MRVGLRSSGDGGGAKGEAAYTGRVLCGSFEEPVREPWGSLRKAERHGTSENALFLGDPEP